MTRIYIIGSFKFYEEMFKIEKMLRAAGLRCSMPKPSKYRDPNRPSDLKSPTAPQELLMADAHEATLRCFHEMDDSDIVYVVNKDGYVGKSTLIDIGYAYAKHKLIYALEPIDDLGVKSLIANVVSPEQLIESAKESATDDC